MNEGASWSGHERNCCFANLGGESFADVSFASGLDFLDDGRAVASVDWDGDGDLDLWLKNRTGPQLRFMRNDHGGGHFIVLQLEGSRANRDAVGARVTVHADRKSFTREVAAGGGYLSQSSRRLHFGLGEIDSVERIVVRWPGGEVESLDGVPVGRRYGIRQGSGTAIALPERNVRIAAAPAEAADAAGESRVLLRVPLPLSPTPARTVYGESAPGRAKLVNLWAHWCPPCIEELSGLAEGYPDVRNAGIDVVALSVDAYEDRARAAEVFDDRIASKMDGTGFSSVVISDETREVIDAILRHVLRRHDELTLPTSLLIDREGKLQMIYLGPLTAERLVADATRFALSGDVEASRRSLSHGRWYFRAPRPLIDLADDLKNRGLAEDARFYFAMAQRGKIVR
jgi:alkyl hydroperoxide reductase subunit AhpC